MSKRAILDAMKALIVHSLVVFDEGCIWVSLKFENEHTKRGTVDSLIDKEIDIMPDSIAHEFRKVRDRVLDSLPDRVFRKPPKEVEVEVEGEVEIEVESNMPEPSAPPGKLFPQDGSKSKKKARVPIEEREAKTPNAKAVKYWHVRFEEIHGFKYSGDIVKMQGQISRLLKRNELNRACCAMNYLLTEKTNDKYSPHTFDHFIKNASLYMVEANEAGYTEVAS